MKLLFSPTSRRIPYPHTSKKLSLKNEDNKEGVGSPFIYQSFNKKKAETAQVCNIRS